MAKRKIENIEDLQSGLPPGKKPGIQQEYGFLHTQEWQELRSCKLVYYSDFSISAWRIWMQKFALIIISLFTSLIDFRKALLIKI